MGIFSLEQQQRNTGRETFFCVCVEGLIFTRLLEPEKLSLSLFFLSHFLSFWGVSAPAKPLLRSLSLQLRRRERERERGKSGDSAGAGESHSQKFYLFPFLFFYLFLLSLSTPSKQNSLSLPEKRICCANDTLSLNSLKTKLSLSPRKTRKTDLLRKGRSLSLLFSLSFKLSLSQKALSKPLSQRVFS